MKSYSNDIPNISTEEMKKTIRINDETNNLVKTNLATMQQFEEEVREICEQFNKKLTMVAVLAGLTLVCVVGLTVNFALIGNL